MKFLSSTFVVISVLYIVVAFESLFSRAEDAEGAIGRHSESDIASESIYDNSDYEESIWESHPIEIYEVKVQILDKISGKVFRQRIKTGIPVSFGNIELILKRAFKNSPEDTKEVYAFIEITEQQKYESHSQTNFLTSKQMVDEKNTTYEFDSGRSNLVKKQEAVLKYHNGKKTIFSNWLFASSMSINLFLHPIYDIRIEF